ncbi:MAG: D-arabinose 5-phosphate isomerase, partial [Candidatus Binatia bacterium]
MSSDRESIVKIARKALHIESQAIAALVDRIGEDFIEAVELIDRCQGRVVTTGMGKSGLIG